jgi:hypothetical protein
VVVTTNGPPQYGNFSVTPSFGYALKTNFRLLASQWLSDELPLTYEFSYVSVAGVSLVLQSPSESSYTVGTLPAGDPAKRFRLTCVADVVDALGANSTVLRTVVVNNTAVNASSLQSMVLSQLAAGSGNANSVMKIISLASSVLNQVDCSKSPNCSALNRFTSICFFVS